MERSCSSNVNVKLEFPHLLCSVTPCILYSPGLGSVITEDSKKKCSRIGFTVMIFESWRKFYSPSVCQFSILKNNTRGQT